VHRWTAEEGRHAIAMRDYMLVKRLVDPIALERFRMTHMSAGYVSAHSGELMRSLAYVSFQELATRVSHRNTGKFTNDPMCENLLTRIAADENLHMIFYRNLMDAALKIAPDQAMIAILDVVKNFEMPGANLPGFQRKAVEMAVEGIYDLRSPQGRGRRAGAAILECRRDGGPVRRGRGRAHGAGRVHGGA